MSEVNNTSKENKKRKFKQNSIFATILVIVGILLLLFIVINISLNLITRHNKELSVPDFTNMSMIEATQLAMENNLRLEVTDSVYIRRMERGLISKQNPEPGNKVKKNRRILLTINSISPKLVEMPSVTGFSLRQAKTELTSKGLIVGKLIYVDDMATNNVLSQQYMNREIAPGTEIESESEIDLILGVNSLDNKTYIPNVLGYKYQTARDILLDNSLNLAKSYFDETVTNYSDSLEAVVYNQIPSASDSIQYIVGDPVRIYLSLDESRLGDQQ